MICDAVIKWNGQKTIVQVKVDHKRTREQNKIIYYAIGYEVYLTKEQVYPLSVDIMRDYKELEEAKP